MSYATGGSADSWRAQTFMPPDTYTLLEGHTGVAREGSQLVLCFEVLACSASLTQRPRPVPSVAANLPRSATAFTYLTPGADFALTDHTF